MRTNRLSSQHGAIMVHVALIFIVVMAFGMIVVDYGVMWVSRNQAQNAADAGAHAGAVALALDSFTDHSETGPAKKAARSFALQTAVFGQQADVKFSDILFYSDAPAKFPAECANDSCVRVDVYRTNRLGRTNPLPMFLGTFVGVNNQGVRATATAQAAQANATNCLKPWAVADRWEENYPTHKTWEPGDRYQPVLPPEAPPGSVPDRYVPPDEGGTTSFEVPDDVGLQIMLKQGDPHDTINPGWFQALDFGGYCPPGSNGSGADCYRDSISGCSSRTYTFGMTVPKENGDMVGPTKQGVEDLVALDLDAEWDPINKKVVNSCVEDNSCVDAQGNHVSYSQSPRIVAIPIFDLGEYMDTGGPGNGTVRIVNILGFFVEGVDSHSTVTGRLATKTDLLVAGGGGVTPDAAFIYAIQLVR